MNKKEVNKALKVIEAELFNMLNTDAITKRQYEILRDQLDLLILVLSLHYIVLGGK